MPGPDRARSAARSSRPASRLLVVLALLATSTLAPPTASAVAGLITLDGVITNPGATEISATIIGDADTTFLVRAYAGIDCDAAALPEAEIEFPDGPPLTTTDGTGNASVVAYAEPPIDPGWFTIVELYAEDGATLLDTSQCEEVTGSLIGPPNLQGRYVLEPDRTMIRLDYGLDNPPTDCQLALDPFSVPNAADFAVTVGGSPATVVNVFIPNEICPLHVDVQLDAPLGTGEVQISYTPGTSPIRNQVGIDAPAFGDDFEGAADRVFNATLSAGASTTTDGEADGALATADRIETTVTNAPAGADVTVDVREENNIGVAGPDPAFRFLTVAAGISVAGATAEDPVAIEFVLDPSLLTDFFGEPYPLQELEVVAQGVRVEACDAPDQALPDPCEVGRSSEADGLHVTVLAADGTRSWTFGADLPPRMLAFQTPHLPELDHVILLFFEEIDVASLPAPEDFTVEVDGVPQSPDRVTLLASGLQAFSQSIGFSGGFSFLELGWETPVAAPYGSITVGYTPGTDPLRDRQGQAVPAQTIDAIISVEDLAIATAEVAVGRDHLLLFMPGRLPAVPAADAFEVLVDDVPFTPIDVVQRFPHLGVTLLDISLPISLSGGEFVLITHLGGPLSYVDGTEVFVDGLFVDTSGLTGGPNGETGESTEPVTVTPPDASTLATPVTVTFPAVGIGGLTTVESAIETTAPSPLPANFAVGDPPAYYEIGTTATFVPPAEICIAYVPSAYADESAVHLLHFENDAWTDVTTSRDTDANRVCGEVTSFSPFAVAELVDAGPTFDFSGFFAPVDNLPTVNTVNSGRAIPVKFSLGGDQGLDIFADGSPTSVRVACPSDPPLDTIESTVPTTSNTLTYDPVGDRYTYVWKTAKAWAGTCRVLTIEFVDGTTVEALFRFSR